MRDLVDTVDQLLFSHGLQSVRGKYLGEEPIWTEIDKKIKSSDGLIALLTRRDQLANGGYTTHPYVLQEIGKARAAGRRAIALVETGIKDDQLGAEAGIYHLQWDSDHPLQTFIDLSATLGTWKLEAGRKVKVQILPEDLAKDVGQSNGTFHCRYRLASEGQFSAWQNADAIAEPGGTFLYVDGVNDQHSIQIEISKNGQRWFAPASQWLGVTLREVK